MYAVMTTGGKQYRVEAGSELVIERLAADAGASVTFDRVLLVGDGDAVTIGTPTVEGASVSGTILGEELGPKLIIFKFKQKATYRRTRGHRQHLVRVRIDEINASGKKAAKAEKAEAAPKVEAAPKAEAAPEAEAAEKPKRTRKPAAAKADATDDATVKPAPRRRSPAKKAESKE
ncbi:MAG TPA: 50S ribosomal protein L21 [Candidatus Limnocylindria bacterium]